MPISGAAIGLKKVYTKKEDNKATRSQGKDLEERANRALVRQGRGEDEVGQKVKGRVGGCASCLALGLKLKTQAPC